MPGPLKCPDCAKSYSKPGALRCHGNRQGHNVSGVVTVVVPFPCPDCHNIFPTLESLVNHSSAQRHGAFKRTDYTSESSLLGTSHAAATGVTANMVPATTNVNSATANAPVFVTEAVAGVFPSDAAIRHKCMICDLSFASESVLNNHYKTSFMHPSCKTCSISFQDKTELSQHLHGVHAADICPCGVVVKFDKLSVHYQASSSHPKCSKCRSAFKDGAALAEHENSAHAEHCVRCDKWFSSQELLSQHFYECFKHPRCIVCKMGFTGNEEYIEHLESAHESPVPIDPVSKMMPPTEETRSPSMAHETACEQLTVTKTTDIEVENSIEPVISMDATPLISGEPDTSSAAARTPPRLAPLQPEINGDVADIAIQTEPWEEGEDHGSDVYEHIDTVDQPAQVNARAVQERPDSVISDFTEIDSLDAISAISYASSPVSSVVAVPSASIVDTDPASGSEAAMNAEAHGLDGTKHATSESYPVAPPSDVCTFGRSTRATSPCMTTTVPLTSTSSSRCATSPSLIMSDASNAPSITDEQKPTSVRTKTSEEVSSVSSVTTSASTTTERSGSVPVVSPADTVAQTNPVTLSWYCRSCGKDPCEDPTATQCGHIFCYNCIVKEIASRMECPACHKVFLLRLQVR
ncbi:hypothetical protein DAEQUDRAFT_727981 [Daedalea quercina L-15889]|uniref:RING-type domain-containing protein n=1 Tax=Daedalea quercina L-15889 TaxID=1314783 RepID=A0A165PMU7_9APHY|nr:hypothetical protein DAEQUDRAFT_727981 [Daedalea quercina L-15889]